MCVKLLPYPILSAHRRMPRHGVIWLRSSPILACNRRFFHPSAWIPPPRLIIAGKTNDIVGRLPGTASGPAIILMAHYDSVYRAPGAGDDASGVASILEILRALKHGPAIQRDVIALFTDGEEEGLLGAEAFAHSHPWMKDAGLILNFEARGNRGPSLLFETSPQ